MREFVHEFDTFSDGSTWMDDDDDLTQDQRAMMETLTGMRHPQPFLFDAGTGVALGDVGVATLTLGRVGSSVTRFAKSGVLRSALGRARTLGGFFGPRLTQITGGTEVQQEAFKELLHAALDVPRLNMEIPGHTPPPTYQNIVWLLMWRHRLFEWIVTEGLYEPWRIWLHPLWSNPVLFEHMQTLLGHMLDDLHKAFEKWYAEHHKEDEKEDDKKDGDKSDHDEPHNTTLMLAAIPQPVVTTSYEQLFESNAKAVGLNDAAVIMLAGKMGPLSVEPSTTNTWQTPFKADLSRWPSKRFAGVITSWLAGGDETHFWRDFGRAVHEDKFELIDQIYRLNLLQLGMLTAETKICKFVTQPL
jgi:hypothetical protein